MINCYKNLTSPKVLNEIDIYHVLDIIKNPTPEIKHLISEAREHEKSGNQREYEDIKRCLPCVTFNFRFDGWKNDKNITGATGFIYIDIDGTTDIDLVNPLIFASWLSLSNQGRGVLVKVDNLTKKNFNKTYEDISKELSIVSDKGAKKATQFTVLSYDPSIYVNVESTTWKSKEEPKNTPSSVLYKAGRKKDATEKGVKSIINYDNIDDYDFGDEEYIFFPDEKELIAKAWIPKTIPKGSRNEKLSSIAYQFRALNPHLSHDELLKLTININHSRCNPPISDEEVQSIVKTSKEGEHFDPILNAPRRVIFNPKSTLTANEKRAITNKLTGKLRSEKTKSDIKACLLNWDVSKQGKVTQTKLAKATPKNIKTIERYYRLFREEISRINKALLVLLILAIKQLSTQIQQHNVSFT